MPERHTTKNWNVVISVACIILLSYTLDTTNMCRMFSSGFFVSVATLETECMCGTSPGMRVMLCICPLVNTLIIPGEILLQSQVYHANEMNILHIIF